MSSEILAEFASNPRLSLDYLQMRLQEHEWWSRRVRILNALYLISVFHDREDVLQYILSERNGGPPDADIFYFAVCLGRFSIVRLLFPMILRDLTVYFYENAIEEYIQLDDFIMRIYSLWKNKSFPDMYPITNPQSYFKNSIIEMIGELGLYTDKRLAQAVPGYVPYSHPLVAVGVPTVGNLECDPEEMFKCLIELGYRLPMFNITIMTVVEERWFDHLDAHEELFQRQWWRTWYTSFINAKTRKTFRPLKIRYHRYLHNTEETDRIVQQYCPIPIDIIQYIVQPYLHEML